MVDEEILEFTILETTKILVKESYACVKISWRASEHWGVMGEFFIKTGLPPTSAGRHILKGSQIGKFHGRIPKFLDISSYLMMVPMVAEQRLLKHT
jgi:hypothetical protein